MPIGVGGHTIGTAMCCGDSGMVVVRPQHPLGIGAEHTLSGRWHTAGGHHLKLVWPNG